MSKHSYRSESIKSAGQHLIAKVALLNRVVVGLDIAKEVQFAVVMSEEREVLSTIRFTSPHENPAFIELLQQFNAHVEVVLESTGTYGDVLLHGFRQAGISVFQIGAKKVNDAKELFDGVPSIHDAKAAMVIAQLHLNKLSRVWKELTPERRELKAAVRTFARYDSAFMANIGRMEALLARAWPELTAELELTSATLLRLVAEFGSPKAVTKAPMDALAFMRKVGRSFLSEDKCKRVIDTARSSKGVPLIGAEMDELKSLAKDTNQLRLNSKEARRRVEKLGQKNESAIRLTSLVGKFSIAVVLMSVGDPCEFESSQSLLKAFGLNLKEKSSGKNKGQLSIAKRGSRIGRRYLFLAALRLIQRERIVRAWYIRRLEKNGGKKVKGVVAVMRKLVRAIWKLARTGESFDASRLFDASNLKTLLEQPQLIIP